MSAVGRLPRVVLFALCPVCTPVGPAVDPEFQCTISKTLIVGPWSAPFDVARSEATGLFSILQYDRKSSRVLLESTAVGVAQQQQQQQCTTVLDFIV